MPAVDINRIAEVVKNVKWACGFPGGSTTGVERPKSGLSTAQRGRGPAGGGTTGVEGFPPESDWDKWDWPMKQELNRLLKMEPHGPHVKGVVASINGLIDGSFKLAGSDDPSFDGQVRQKLDGAVRFCLQARSKGNANSVVGAEALPFAQAFLRVAALYHDIGKIIGTDRHVSRGVHLMRDVKDSDRQAFEQGLMGGAFEDKHNFWTLLSHHDVFGCLCTGEASLPALSQMVSWSGAQNLAEPHKSPAALVSYLLLLNCADGDSSLRFIHGGPGGLRTVEVRRYLDDWESIRNLLWDDNSKKAKEVSREGFREALLGIESHPERTIERVTRMVTTSYRMQMPRDLLLDESEVTTLVEDELGMLHGARLQMFCFLFARFCKIDYCRRFFDVLMLYELLDKEHGLRKCTKDLAPYESPLGEPMSGIRGLAENPKDEEYRRRRSACLKGMTRRVCSILKRIVDDYGGSVSGDPLSAPLMCIVMANLMPEPKGKIAWAICRALAEHESRALAWVSEEVAVSPYGA